ncbi:DUF7344 domain-containing protein [Haloparvum sedimenti]|uniref:DUF7344 domain-containing protein n=1 Tax=Haloparvum sedimenti TaxID=1678448 RepID=UPI00071E82BD|nr:hypothetical protein [Haloparvum sedimenti]
MNLRSSEREPDEKNGSPDRVAEPDSMDTVLKVLSNRRRRDTVRYLKEVDEQVPVRDIARQVAAWENDVETDAVTYDQRKRVYTSLHQSHLPRLAREGFIDYDRNRGTVSLTPDADDLQIYLEVVTGKDLLWSEYYLGLAVVAFLLVGAAAIGTPPFAALSGTVYGLLTAAVLGVSAIVHLLSTRKNALSE